jgi:hypothetical protein
MEIAFAQTTGTDREGTYVRVSGDAGTVTVCVPNGVDPRAFLNALPWMFVERRLESPAGRNLWLHAHLFLCGRPSEELYFIADS